MAKTDIKIRDLSTDAAQVQENLDRAVEAKPIVEYLSPVNGAPAAGQFRSEINKRADIVDMSKLPAPYMGVERIRINRIEEATGETAADGSRVFKCPQDPYDRIRMTGDRTQVFDDGNGKRPIPGLNNINDFIEITFYGTGVNILYGAIAGNKDWRVSVDGGPESGDITAVASDNLLNGRNYSANTVLVAASGLSMGLHTVKIRDNFGGGDPLDFSGLEIVCDVPDIKIPASSLVAGGQKHDIVETDLSLTSFAVEEGTDNGQGGRVSIYLDPADSTVKQAIRWSDAQQTFAGTDHSGEEVMRKYAHNQFGRARADDWSRMEAAFVDRGFAIEDASFQLVGKSIREQTSRVIGAQYNTTTAGHGWSFTFYGTGVDVIVSSDNSSRQFDELHLDGSVLATDVTISQDDWKVLRVASGLDFGMHCVSVQADGASPALDSPRLLGFIVYGTKKPELPEGAVELGSYFKTADYSAAPASATNEDIPHHSTGSITYCSNRETTYNGTGWTHSGISSSANEGLIRTWSNVTNDFSENHYFGTGVDYHFYQSAVYGHGELLIDGLVANTTNYPGLIVDDPAGIFNSSTGIVDSYNAISRKVNLGIRGLPLGFHTYRLRVTGTKNASSGGFFVSYYSAGAITPMHSFDRDVMRGKEEWDEGRQSIRRELVVGKGSSKDKLIASGGIDLGPDRMKWQRKSMNGNTTSTGRLYDLTFYNLKPGMTYRLTANIVMNGVDQGGSTRIEVENGGVSIARMAFHAPGSGAGNDQLIGTGRTLLFVARDPVLEMSVEAISGEITGSGGNSWAQIEELPHHVEVDDFGSTHTLVTSS